jgi:hypothetical protein
MKNTIEKYKGLTFAEASMKISKKYANKETDFIEKASYEKEMEDLTNHQTNVRMATEMKEQLKQFKKGGTLPKYPHGTPHNGLPQAEDPWNGVNPNLPFIDNPFQGMINELPQSTLVNPPVPPTLPQKGKKMIPGQMPVLGQRGVNPISTTQATVPQVGQIPFKVNVDESNVSTQPRGSGEMSAYTPALIGQGISTAINAGILAKGYDKVAPVDNPYESQVINNMASRGIDTTQQRNQILSAYNAAKESLSNARSANVQQALGTNLMNVTQSNLADSKLNEQQLNNQYKADFAQTLGSLGQQKASAQVYSEDMTARNKGTWQSELSKLGTSVADSAKFFTEKNLNTINNDMLLSILNQKYPSIKIDESFATRLSQGKTTPQDFLMLKQTLGDVAANNIIKKFGE